MDKKLKREIIIVAVFFFIVTGIWAIIFTGFLGKPCFVYLYSYNNQTENGYVRPDDVYEISVYYDYKNLKVAEYALKYCNNVTELETYGEHFKNLNFLKGHQKLKKLELDGECDDWSMLSDLKNVETLHFLNSDFSDISLIYGYSNLKTLCFASSDITKKFTSLCNSDALKPFKEMTYFSIWGYIIDIDILEAVSQLDDDMTVYLISCGYDGDKEEAKKILASLSSKGWDVEFKDGVINASVNVPSDEK